MRESVTFGLVIYELEDVWTGVAWTLGFGTHESGTLIRGTREHEAPLREDSPRRGTVSMRARGREKQTAPAVKQHAETTGHDIHEIMRTF